VTKEVLTSTAVSIGTIINTETNKYPYCIEMMGVQHDLCSIWATIWEERMCSVLFYVTVIGETYLEMLRTFHVCIFDDIPITQMKTTLFSKVVCYITSSVLCMMSSMSHF